MTQNEFIKKAVGIPWVRWRSDWEGCDCYGLVVLFYREVMGVDLPDVPQTEFADGLPEVLPRFNQLTEPFNGACGFMSFKDGFPTHCGIYLGDGMMLHSHGSESQRGSVRLCKLSMMTKIFGEIRFYGLAD